MLNTKGTSIKISKALHCAKYLQLILWLWIFSVDAFAQAPLIQTFSPASGPIGTSVTINGNNFNATASGNIVFFGATQAAITSASVNKLVVTVPVGATNQPPSVLNTATHLTGYASKPFDVTFSTDNTFTDADFTNRITLATGVNPSSAVSVVDIDGDGKPDLVVANESSNTVSVYRNITAVGSTNIAFEPEVDFTVQRPIGVTVSDIDGDGKPDLVVSGQGVYVFRNTSVKGVINSSSFAQPNIFSIGNSDGTGPVVIGDVDGDGKPDMLGYGYFGAWFSVMQNNSSPGLISFGPRVDFYLAGGPAIDISMGDLDGDGKPDVIITETEFSSAMGSFVYKNVAQKGIINTTSFSSPVAFINNYDPAATTIEDIDGDGKPEIVRSSGFGLDIMQNGTTNQTINTASFANDVFFSGYSIGGLSSVDINGDGKPDVTVAAEGRVIIYDNTSSQGNINAQSLSAPVIFSTDKQQSKITVADLNGDGKPEIITADFFENTISIISSSAKAIIPPTGTPPKISYQTPQVYTVNTAITALAPTNTGGAVPANVYGQVSTFAGNGNIGSADGLGAAARFNDPRGITIDNANDIYVADNGGNKIRMITPAGQVTTVAGSGSTGAVNATGINATFTNPTGLTVDAAGNIYVADSGNQLIRKIMTNGGVSTYAGSGFAGLNDGSATSASFDFPNDAIIDNTGNIYVSDYVNDEIRKIAPNGAVSTLAGNSLIGSADGTGSAARFYHPSGLTFDASATIILPDASKVNPEG